jgi:hypothetical protein
MSDDPIPTPRPPKPPGTSSPRVKALSCAVEVLQGKQYSAEEKSAASLELAKMLEEEKRK